jgi:hypothetical protein
MLYVSLEKKIQLMHECDLHTFGCLVEVGIIKHENGAIASKLQSDFLETVGAELRYKLTNACLAKLAQRDKLARMTSYRSGEGDFLDKVVPT